VIIPATTTAVRMHNRVPASRKKGRDQYVLPRPELKFRSA